MPRVVHFEVPASDPEKIAEFYRNAFGWDITKWDGPRDYWLATTGPEEKPGINGAFARKRDMIAEGVVLTVQVDSVEATVRSITDAGGTRVTPRVAIPGVGYFSSSVSWRTTPRHSEEPVRPSCIPREISVRAPVNSRYNISACTGSYKKQGRQELPWFQRLGSVFTPFPSG